MQVMSNSVLLAIERKHGEIYFTSICACLTIGNYTVFETEIQIVQGTMEGNIDQHKLKGEDPVLQQLVAVLCQLLLR